MKTLDPPAPAKAVLSFDFDGTLHHPADTPPVPAAFFELIERLRAEQGIVWGINTGRSLPQMIEGFIESRFPFLPDWIIAREREIFFPDSYGRWISHHDWNRNCEAEIAMLFKRSRKLLEVIRHQIEEHTGAQWIEMAGEPAGVISRTHEEMEWIVERIGPVAAAEPQLGWQRNSIYLRFGHRDFQKGSSLLEVARHYQLSATECFAVGDSHNDMEMLDPSNAAMNACPANAVDVILEKIGSTGGFLATASHGEGAIEAINHYFLSPKIPLERVPEPR